MRYREPTQSMVEDAERSPVTAMLVAMAICLTSGQVQASVPIGPELQLSTSAVSSGDGPDIAMDADGDFVVVWEYGNSVIGRRGSFCGTLIGGEFTVGQTTSSRHLHPRVAVATEGSFIVVWDDPDAATIMARMYDADATPLDTAFQVNSVTDSALHNPDISLAEDGKFTIVWSSDENVYCRRFLADGSAVVPEIVVGPANSDYPFASPRVGMRNDGFFKVLWIQTTDYLSEHLFIQRYDSSGDPIGSRVPLAYSMRFSHRQLGFDMAEDGRFVVSYASYGMPTPYTPSYFTNASRHSDDGTKVMQLPTSQSNYGGGYDGAAAWGDDDHFIVAWRNSGAFIREYTDEGPITDEVAIGDWGFDPAVAFSGEGGFAVWNALLNGNAVIKARRLTGPWTVASNLFGTGESYTSLYGLGSASSNSYAVGFTMGAEAYGLTRITLQLEILDAANVPTVELYDDSGGNPGSLLMALSSTAPPPMGVSTLHFKPVQQISLLAGTTYWLVVRNSSSGADELRWLAHDYAFNPIGIATHAGYRSGLGYPPSDPSHTAACFEVIGKHDIFADDFESGTLEYGGWRVVQ